MWPCLSCMDVGHAWKMLPEVRNVVCKEKREKSPMCAMYVCMEHIYTPARARDAAGSRRPQPALQPRSSPRFDAATARGDGRAQI